MLTYTDQQNLAIEISGLSDAGSLLNFKRDINAGTARFLAKLSRPVDRQSRFTNMVASQQYYQLPEDAIRVSKIKALNGTNIWRSLTEVPDEDAWIALNSIPQSGSYPTHYFVKGYDEFGVYPTPSAAVTDGLELVYEPKHVMLTASDYTTGTINVTNGSATVTANTGTFIPQMANGSYVLQVTDGNDGNYYKISGYTNGTTITLENFYQGITSTSATYRIGQVSKIPEEYQEAPVDYAMFRHYLGKNEKDNAMLYQKLWLDSLKDAENTYGLSTGNQIVNASGSAKSYNPMTGITANQIKV